MPETNLLILVMAPNVEGRLQLCPIIKYAALELLMGPKLEVIILSVLCKLSVTANLVDIVCIV